MKVFGYGILGVAVTIFLCVANLACAIWGYFEAHYIMSMFNSFVAGWCGFSLITQFYK